MLDLLASAVAATKDRIVEASAKAFLNGKFEKFGAVTKLQLDSKNKTLCIELLLKGESLPVSINVGAYELTERDGASCLVLQRLDASREWVGAVLNEFVAGRPFKLPEGVKGFL
jgi:hypothetical protein